MTFEKAVKLLEAEYERAKNLAYVQKPLAWALYQVWKEADSTKYEKSVNITEGEKHNG